MFSAYQTDAYTVMILPLTMSPYFFNRSSRLNQSVILFFVWLKSCSTCLSTAIQDYIMIPDACPSTLFMPSVNQCSISEFRITAMYNYFFNLSHFKFLIPQIPNPMSIKIIIVLIIVLTTVFQNSLLIESIHSLISLIQR